MGTLEAGGKSSTRADDGVIGALKAGESSTRTGAAKAGTACLIQTGGAIPMDGGRLTCID